MNDKFPRTVATALLCDHGTVDGRALHADLDIGRHFTNWMCQRIIECNLVEGVDYEIVRVSPDSRQHGGHNRIDYDLTLSAARQIVMSENTEVGRIVRKYVSDNFVRRA